MKIIIALVGPFKSGKTIAAQHLQKKYQAIRLRFSEFLEDTVKSCHCLDHKDRQILQRMSTALRGEFGDNLLGRIVDGFVKKSKANIFVLDGVRRIGDIEYLRNMPGFGLVSIDADPKVRWQRAKKQSDKSDDAEKTFEQFLEEENNEADARIRDVMREADFCIDTTHLIKQEHFYKLEEILSEIKRRTK